MLWRVLGPLEVRAGEGWAGVAAPKRRAVLAALLAVPGEVVSTGGLVDELWGDDPPHSARQMVSGYVLRLRQLIGDPAGRVLVTQAPGYRLATGRADMDAGRFEELLAAGKQALAGDDAEQAAVLCAEALSLWRGAALADVPRGPLAAAEADRLEELKLAAAELRTEAVLRCGGAADLVPGLRRLAAAHPLREVFWYQLMRALQGCGRPAEALEVYAQAREVIADQLGADPGPDLQRLHRRLLAGDPPSASPVGAPQAAGSAVPSVVPRQLPAGVRAFVGRTEELRRLSGLLDDTAVGASTVLISAIGGTAGVGKTALAVHWAHQVADRFPDGQLYADLRGYDAGQRVPAADVLAGFLRALDVPGHEIPPGIDEQAARYRSLLAGRRMLVLLDNVGEAEQIRPLLPGAPGCIVVVTSRDALAGLVARDGAVRLDLDLLPPADAAGLLQVLIGERATAEPDAVTALAERCCRLPLALRIAAELAAARPVTPLSALVDELADVQCRLDLLDAGADPRTAVRGVFSWSCRHLDDAAVRVFQLAGLHPGTALDAYAAAALAGTTVEQAGQVLDRLARANLIHVAGPGRYGMHDLLHGYAHELAVGDSPGGQRAALSRLFDYYLCAAAAAMDILVPAELDRRPRMSGPAGLIPALAGPAAARAWLDTERDSLVAVAGHTAAHGWPGHTTQLAATLRRYLSTGYHHPEGITIHSCAYGAARDTGDLAAEAAAMDALGLIAGRQGRYQQAAGHLDRALDLYRQVGDRPGEASALNNLGGLDWRQGRYQQAAEYLRLALDPYHKSGDRLGEARTLGNLGVIDERQGRYQQAVVHHRQALALFRETGDRLGEARTLANLGVVELRQGRYQQAARHLLQALDPYREAGDPNGEAHALASLGAVELLQGRYQQAAGHQRQALALFHETDDPAGEAEAFNGLAEVSLATGQPDHAHTQHTTALSLASQSGDTYQQARAYQGLGSACQAAGDLAQARHHWQHALTLYASLGAPEVGDVRAQLETVNRHLE